MKGESDLTEVVKHLGFQTGTRTLVLLSATYTMRVGFEQRCDTVFQKSSMEIGIERQRLVQRLSPGGPATIQL
jgi:hypothetical protein